MTSHGHDDQKKEVPPLSLVPDDDASSDKTDNTKYCQFKLLTSPGSTTVTSKFAFTMLKVDGSQSIRDHIQWTRNLEKVWTGLNLTNNEDKRHIAEETCLGSVLTAYKAGIDTASDNAWMAARQAAFDAVTRGTTAPVNPGDPPTPERQSAWMARQQAAADAVPRPPLTDYDLKAGISAVMVAVCPYVRCAAL